MSTRPVAARFEGFGWRPLGRRRPVVADLNLAVEPGQRVLLAGPSGAGKSTLLLALAGALGETIAGDLTGTVHVDGRIGLVQQNPGDSIVAERLGRDIAFGPENIGRPREEIWASVDRALDAVGLPYGRDYPSHALSGGEVQRLALAGALALEPGLLLLDEPTSMLDDDNAASVRAAVVDTLDATGATAIIVEHRIEPWLGVVDRVVVLGADGTIAADTTPTDFVERFTDQLAAEGVWMPGLPAPEPVVVDRALTQPDVPVGTVDVEWLVVELRQRGLRGTTVTTALNGVSASFGSSAMTSIVGPSGAGKSTLLATVAGLQKPTSGRVLGLAAPPHELRSRQLAASVGWVPQNAEHGIIAPTVADEIRLTADRLGRPVDVDAVLDVVGLADRAGANPFRLSGGEQRRLALAAALAHRPGLLCLDEPTVGQDRRTWAAVVGWAKSAAAAGSTVITATHDDLLVAASNHVVRLEGGVLA